MKVLIIIAVLSLVIFLMRKAYVYLRGGYCDYIAMHEISSLNLKYYRVLRDVVFEVDGKTHKIDYMALSKYGIFVMKVRNFGGIVTGGEDDEFWIEQNKFFKKKRINPIKVNKKEIKALAKYLHMSEDNFFSFICLPSQCKIDTTNYKSLVGDPDSITYKIVKYKKEIVKEDVLKLYNELNKLVTTKNNLFKEHVLDSIYFELNLYHNFGGYFKI